MLLRRRTVSIFGQIAVVSLILLASFALNWPGEARADDDPVALCEQAVALAATETDVPISALIRAYSQTGQAVGMRPWPWTVNVDGKPIWFDTEAQALAYLFRHFKRGSRHFQIGCFQINFKRHSNSFASIEEMFDPIINARYAATLLRQSQKDHPNWEKAIAAIQTQLQADTRRFATSNAPNKIPSEVIVGNHHEAPKTPDNSSHQNAGSLMPLSRADTNAPLLFSAEG